MFSVIHKNVLVIIKPNNPSNFFYLLWLALTCSQPDKFTHLSAVLQFIRVFPPWLSRWKFPKVLCYHPTPRCIHQTKVYGIWRSKLRKYFKMLFYRTLQPHNHCGKSQNVTIWECVEKEIPVIKGTKDTWTTIVLQARVWRLKYKWYWLTI